ncbi:unannotated protein [freshwater metagenome]|uniref:Unannotated protein n=1 Tax=freshwater metagenome TaxID=449393 RepID=A0A6J7ENA3_9ZZZZ
MVAESITEPVRAGGERGELVELRVAESGDLLPRGMRGEGARKALPAHARLEPVGELWIVEPPRQPQPNEQVGSAAVRERCPQHRDQRSSQRGVTERHATLERDRHAGLGEDPFDQRSGRLRIGQRHRDVLGSDAAGDRFARSLGQQLKLGALAAAIEQGDRIARIRALAGRFEERALEVVQRRARLRLIVLGERRQPLVTVGNRGEVPESPGAGAVEIIAIVFVRQRDRHRRDPGQRLDNVQLDRRQVVESVEENRPFCPAARLLEQR